MKRLRIGLWVAQVLLAVAFLATSLMKLTQPYEALAASQAWVKLFSPEIVKLIGAVELLGMIGLILPAATRIVPVLTPVAATGLVLTMVGAAATHLRIGEPPIPNLVLGSLAAFVAWGRFKKAPHRSAETRCANAGTRLTTSALHRACKLRIADAALCTESRLARRSMIRGPSASANWAAKNAE